MKTVKFFILCSLMLLLGNSSLLANTEISRLDKISTKAQHYKGGLKSMPVPLNVESYLCDNNSIMLKALDDQSTTLEVTVTGENGAVAYHGVVEVQGNSFVVLPLQNPVAGSYTLSFTDYDVLMEGEFIIQEDIE